MFGRYVDRGEGDRVEKLEIKIFEAKLLIMKNNNCDVRVLSS